MSEKLKVIIIEDEHLIAKNLESVILKCRLNYEVIKFLSSVEEAKSYFEGNTTGYNLIFSDISLGDGNCFEVFESIKIQSPIIFCTAFDKYAIEAFNTSGIDYILKPVNKDRIEKAILKFESLAFSSLSQQEKIINVSSKIKEGALFLVNFRERVIPFESKAIAIFYIQDGIVYLLDFNNRAYVINKSLEDIEIEAGFDFYRANRQFLVNRSAIKDFSRTSSRKIKINLTFEFTEAITISKEKISAFLKWISYK